MDNIFFVNKNILLVKNRKYYCNNNSNMNIIIGILVFCIVLFCYLHIYFHLKISNDLEVYELNNPSKYLLEEVCDLRQPVLFEFNNEKLFECCSRINILDTYGAFDIKSRNVKDEINMDEELFIPLPFTSTLKVLENDTENKYLIENNNDFLEETGLIKSYKYNDNFLRPYMVSNCIYDILMGSNGTTTPFRYELNYRNYFLVTEGSMKIKIAPPKSTRYLYEIKDYENMEFRSSINPWKVQSQYKQDFDKVKCLELIVKKGYIMFIPAFWWYTIEFGENTTICSFKYRTYMNNIAILDNIFKKILQSQNVKRNIVKQIDFKIEK